MPSIGISLVEKIRTDILTARLEPGTKLTVKMLSDLNDCGATPVREALNRLVSDGLVRRIDRRGFFVAGISRAEFEDILFNRCFMEGEALRRSIARGGVAWEERVLVTHYTLGRLPQELPTPEGAVPNPDWETAHRAFHAALLSGCESDFLLGCCDRLRELNNRYRFTARRAPGLRRSVEDEHARLRDLALARQADEAVAALVEHYTRTGSAVFAGTEDAEAALPGARRARVSQGRARA